MTYSSCPDACVHQCVSWCVGPHTGRTAARRPPRRSGGQRVQRALCTGPGQRSEVQAKLWE